jgi:hypothetical protein
MNSTGSEGRGLGILTLTHAERRRAGPHTRRAYLEAIREFLDWCEDPASGRSPIIRSAVDAYMMSAHVDR